MSGGGGCGYVDAVGGDGVAGGGVVICFFKQRLLGWEFESHEEGG